MAEKLIRDHRDLEVYKLAFDAAMRIFEISRSFPPEERYSLTDQIRKASRSVCAHIAEAWRRRRYRGAFLSCLNGAEAEAAETQVWTAFALKCGYLADDEADELNATYDRILGMLVNLIMNPDPWLLRRK